MELQPPIISLEHIRKVFGGVVVANDDVCISARKGSIHAIIGENGAGKSTIMNILYGLLQPDSGKIVLKGQEVKIISPSHGIQHGLGMVTQHTTMIPALTVLENIILGAEPGKFGIIDKAKAIEKLQPICTDLSIDIPLNKQCEAISVAALQKAEIVKTIYRGAEMLILDEPTATLSPAEAASLFSLLKKLVSQGSTVIFITHKMSEVMDHSDDVTVIRAGRTVGQFKTADTSPPELVQLMVGNEKELTLYTHTGLSYSEPPTETAVCVSNLITSAKSGSRALKVSDLRVGKGEIVGIAGVDGSGQRELAMAIAGLIPIEAGEVTIAGNDVSLFSPAQRIALGLGYVHENRQTEGLVLDFNIADNLLLGREDFAACGGGRLLNRTLINELGNRAVTENHIRAKNGLTRTGSLSGGNQQKVVIARALSGNPKLIIAMQPTRGLDAEAIQFVYTLFEKSIVAGAGMLLFSLDLDEILTLSDRVAVLFEGKIQGVLDRKDASIESIGALMVGGAV